MRSTAISGLGLVVSLVSLAVLLTWWLRTIIRVRRSRRKLPCRPPRRLTTGILLSLSTRNSHRDRSHRHRLVLRPPW